MRIGHLAIIVQILPGARAELSTDRHTGELFTGGVSRPTDATGEHDSGGMTFSIVALAGAQPAFEDTWQYAEVRRLLQGVIEELETVHPVLRSLSEDTGWRVRDSAITSLHERLTDHAHHVSGAVERITAAGRAYLA